MALPHGKANPLSSTALAAAFAPLFADAKLQEQPPKERYQGLEPDNPRVAQCCQAYIRAFEAARARGASEYAAGKEAARAYRNLMPTLTGAQNILDFIACVAHGMLLDGIDVKDGGRLLYAAQVAQAGIARPTASQTKSVPERQPIPPA
jgi:hypothetical protein